MIPFNLHSHQSRQRVNIKMVECHICGEDFARKDVLSRHLKRKYPCDGSKSRQKGRYFSAVHVLNIPTLKRSEVSKEKSMHSDKKSKSDESLLAQDMDHEVLGTSYLCTSRSIEQAQVDIEVRLGKALKHTMTFHLNDN